MIYQSWSRIDNQTTSAQYWFDTPVLEVGSVKILQLTPFYFQLFSWGPDLYSKHCIGNGPGHASFDLTIAEYFKRPGGKIKKKETVSRSDWEESLMLGLACLDLGRVMHK